MTTEQLDLTTPEGSRRYIQISREQLLPPGTDRVKIGGIWINLDNMTDVQAIKIATSIYWDFEQEVLKGMPKQ